MMVYTLSDRDLFPTKTGVYSIYFLNSESEKVYIGSGTVTNGKQKSHNGIYARWDNHIYLLRRNKHQKKLQNAYNKYGEQNIRFKVLEFCEPENCLDREDFYLIFYDSCKNGYNIKPLASSCLGYKRPKEVTDKIKKTVRNKRRHLELKIIETYLEIKSQPKTGEKFGVSSNMVNNILKENGIRVLDNGESRRLEIFCYTINGNFIGSWLGAKECAKQLGLKSVCSISHIASGRLTRYKGYTFRYDLRTKEQITSELEEREQRGKEASAKGPEKRMVRNIKQLDLNGNLIKVWETSKEIRLFFRLPNVSHILKCIKEPHRQTLGFKWSL